RDPAQVGRRCRREGPGRSAAQTDQVGGMEVTFGEGTHSRRRPVKTDSAFLLYPANRAFLDGKKRLPVSMARPGTWIVGAVALLLTLSGLGLIAKGWWEERNFTRLKVHGVKTVATVAHLREYSQPSDSHSPDIYSVTYRYSVNGKVYEQEAGLSWSEYADLS